MLIPEKILPHGREATLKHQVNITKDSGGRITTIYNISIVYYNDIVIPLIPFVNDEIWLQ